MTDPYRLVIARPWQLHGFTSDNDVLPVPRRVEYDELVVDTHPRGGVTISFANTSYTLGKRNAHEFASQIHRLADVADNLARRFR